MVLEAIHRLSRHHVLIPTLTSWSRPSYSQQSRYRCFYFVSRPCSTSFSLVSLLSFKFLRLRCVFDNCSIQGTLFKSIFRKKKKNFSQLKFILIQFLLFFQCNGSDVCSQNLQVLRQMVPMARVRCHSSRPANRFDIDEFHMQQHPFGPLRVLLQLSRDRRSRALLQLHPAQLLDEELPRDSHGNILCVSRY